MGTRDWIMAFLISHGIHESDGELAMTYKDSGPLMRVSGAFTPKETHTLNIDGEMFQWDAGRSIELMSSHRHTPKTFEAELQKYGLKVNASWMFGSGEESIYLISR